jgi:hypothetical protein
MSYKIQELLTLRTWQMSYKIQDLLTLSEQLDSSPVFGGVYYAYLGFLYCVVFVVFVFILLLVCSMLPASLDCQFLIAPSVFSKVRLHLL